MNGGMGGFHQLQSVQTAFTQQVNYTALAKSFCKNYNQIVTKVLRVQLNVCYFLLQTYKHIDYEHNAIVYEPIFYHKRINIFLVNEQIKTINTMVY